MLHGEFFVVTLGSATVAGRIRASVVAWALAAAAPAVGCPAPAGPDGLPVGVGVELPVPVGVGVGVPVGEGDPEPVGVGDAVADVDGELDECPPDGPSWFRHGTLVPAEPVGAVELPDPVLGNGRLEWPATPLPWPCEPPPADPPCRLCPLEVETTAGTSMATYAPTATMNTAIPKAVSGRSKLNGEDWPSRELALPGAGRNRSHTVRSLPAS